MQLVFVGILACATSLYLASRQHPPSLIFSAQPAEAYFQLGEPILILLRFENKGPEEFTLNLGTSDVEMLDVVLQEGQKAQDRIQAQGTPVPGIGLQEVVNIAPGGSYTHSFLLNKLVTPDHIGTFELRVRFKGTALPEAVAKIRIQPQRKGLTDDLKNWMSLVEGPASNWRERLRSLEYIIYTHSAKAFPYQRKLLDNKLLSPEQIVVLVISMLAGKQYETVKLLAARLGEPKPEPNKHLAYLFALKTFGLNKLTNASAKLIAGYQLEIERAAPFGISN